ncbi:hypothetical protein [Bremerella alba]|uniref:Gamma-glutamylcyclotransferase n=1 Tax=Bremerella alba TaxID=980252 RepID=A0A7V8V267_9BACT|nr:hypothetical protein [Bremerella alba]MBA2113563.1 hypothetical protein [Bremerella alba]
MISHQFEESRILDRIASIKLPLDEHQGKEHSYPWELESILPHPESRISLVGYGSLINLKSACRTFAPETVRQARPVIVLKARRVYEYVMSPRGRQVYGGEICKTRCGVLNARPTDSIENWFNGLVFSLNLSEMQSLINRESAYDLISAWTTPWNDDGSSPSTAYFLSCRQQSFGGRRTINPDLLPHPKYHAVCEQGCREVSAGFLDAFHNSTWVRDTRLVDTDSL